MWSCDFEEEDGEEDEDAGGYPCGLVVQDDGDNPITSLANSHTGPTDHSYGADTEEGRSVFRSY